VNIIFLVLGYLIGLSKFKYILRIILSCGISFIILKLFNSNLRLWSLDEYDDYDNYIKLYNSNYFWSWLLVIAIMLVFYWIIPLLISKLVDKKFSKFVQNFYKLPLFEQRVVKVIMTKSIKKIVRFILKFSFSKPSKKIENEEENDLSSNESVAGIYTLFSFLLQLFICWIGIDLFRTSISFIWIVIIMLLFSIIGIIFIPLIDIFKSSIFHAVKTEINSHVK
jgi:hypothetical protein